MAAPQYPGQLGASQNIKSCSGERTRLASNINNNSSSSRHETDQQTESQSVEVAPQITNSAEERVQTTEFSDDNAILVEPAAGESILSNRGTQQHTDSRNHDVISYLGRPQIVATFDWPAESTRNAQLATVRIPDALLSKMYLNKLEGFTSFRATAVFKLQMNAQPFQCGRLLMYAVPMPSLVEPRGKFLSNQVSMAQALHNVQIDITKHSQVELRVPFVSPFNSYDLINGLYPWADLYIQVYSPLNQIEQNDLICQLWAHFEDVELGAPTSGIASAAKQQSGSVSQTRTGTPAPRMASAGVVNAIRSVESSGAIQKIGSGAQGAYGIIGKGIPALSPITNALSTFSKAGTSLVGGLFGGGAQLLGKLLGFSKPVLDHSGNTVVIRPSQYFANVDGIDHSHVLSLNVLNAIEEYPSLGGTDMAETSLTYLKKIPQFFTNFCYSTNTKYGDVLSEWLVTPSTRIPANVLYMGKDTAVKNPLSTIQPTVLNYISSSFAYWTGSLVYTLRFVKTDYHSGRVEVSFHPFVSEPNSERTDFTYRLIVDLREKTEVSFVVPFISPQPWKTFNPEIDPMELRPWNMVGGSVTGSIQVRAITPLMCASAIVGKTIDCVIECRAGDDYFVQAPVRSVWVPITLAAEPAQRIAKQQSGGIYALPGTQETRTSSLEGFLPPSITGDEKDIKRDDTSMLCAGEIFLDFRSLIKRFCFTRKHEVTKGQVLLLDAMDLVRAPLVKWDKWHKDGDEDRYNRFSLLSCPTPLTYVANMFAFYRGSVRLKVYNADAKNNLLSCQLLYKPDYGYPNSFGDIMGLSRLNYIGPEAYEQPNDKQFAEFQVPYYSPTIITVPYPTAEVSTLYSQPLVTAAISSTNFDSDQTYFIAAAAGDDLSFHMFLGVPPCFYNKDLESTVTGQGDSPSRFDYSQISVDPTQQLRVPGTTAGWVWNSKETGFVDVTNLLFDYYDADCPRAKPAH